MTLKALARDEVDELLALYALDALDDIERAQVVEYLGEHPAANNEVNEYRQAALQLRGIEGPSAGVWDRIAAHVEVSPRAPVVVSLDRQRRLRSQVPKLIAIAAAVVGLSGTAVALSGSDDTGTVTPANVDQVVPNAPGSADDRHVTVTFADGGGSADLLILASGAGSIVNTTITAATDAATQRLYAVTDGGIVEIATLGGSAPIAFKAPAGTTSFVIAANAP